MKITVAKIISFLMIITLPFGNVTKLIGIEDGFSLITISLLLIFLTINFIQNFKINFLLNPAGIIFIILVFATLINLSLNNIGPFDAFSNIFKVLTFILLIDFLKNNELVFQYFLSKYYKVYLFSIFISLPVYYVFPYDEFVFYDGFENRFAGLHFELFNFIFSTSLFFISWMYNKKNIVFGLLITFLLMYFAKSNVFYLYMLVFFFVFIFKSFFINKNFTYLSVFTIILSPIAIGMFLELLNFLNIFAIREVTSFSHQGSSLYTRLYPFSLAVQHINESGWTSFFPMGLGYFENSDKVINDSYSFGGTGSPKALVDLGIILFLFLCFYISKIFYYNIKNVKDSHQYPYLILIFSTLIFLSFGAGFFNIIGWFCIFSTGTRFWLKLNNNVP